MLKKIFSLFKIVVFIHLLFCLVNGMMTAFFVSLFNFVLLFIADYLQKKLKYKDVFQLLIYLFLICSLIGGEVYYLYVKIWYFDIVMHVLSSFIVSGLILCIIKIFNVKINFSLLIVFIFSFAMMVASLWEITEFTIDRLFDKDMQKDTVINEINSVLLSIDGKSVIKKEVNSMNIGSIRLDGYLDIGLYDTTIDMVCAIIGSILFIIIYKLKESL